MPRRRRLDRVDHKRAAQILRAQWKAVVGIAESKSAVSFVDDASYLFSFSASLLTQTSTRGPFSVAQMNPIPLHGMRGVSAQRS